MKIAKLPPLPEPEVFGLTMTNSEMESLYGLFMQMGLDEVKRVFNDQTYDGNHRSHKVWAAVKAFCTALPQDFKESKP